MNLILNLILAFSLSLGQLIKIPVSFVNISLLDLSLIFLITYCLINGKFRLSKSSYFTLFGFIFLIWGTIGLIFSPLNLNFAQFMTSFLYGLRIGLILLFGYLVFIKLYHLKISDANLIFLLSGLAVAIIGLTQFIFVPDLSFLAQYGWDPHYFRLASTFLDPNFTGSYLALSLIMLYLTPDKFFLKWKKIIFGLSYLALLLTFSRSSYLCFALGFLTISLFQKSVKTFLLTVILVLILFGGYRVYYNLVAQPHNINRMASAESRLSSYQQGLAIFEKNPIFGIGFNGYRYGLEKYHLAPLEQTQGHSGSSNDSSLLFVLSTGGILGFVIYLLFLMQIFLVGLKSFSLKNYLGVGLMGSLFGLLGQSFFINTLFYPPLLLFLITYTACLETLFKQTK